MDDQDDSDRARGDHEHEPAQPQEAPRGRTLTLKVSQILCDYSINARDHGHPIAPSSVADLAQRIRRQGMLQNPAVWQRPSAVIDDTHGHPFQLLAGFRRFTAVVHVLGWTAIEVKCVEAKTLREARLKNLIENVDRENLRPYDLGLRAEELKNDGLAAIEIGQALGRSGDYAKDLIRIRANLHPIIERQWRKREFPVVDLVRISCMDQEEQLEAFEILTTDDNDNDDEGENDKKSKRSRPQRAAGELPMPRMIARLTLEKYLVALNHTLRTGNFGTVLIKGEYHPLDAFSTQVAIEMARGCLGMQKKNPATKQPIAFFAGLGMPGTDGLENEPDIPDGAKMRIPKTKKPKKEPNE